MSSAAGRAHDQSLNKEDMMEELNELIPGQTSKETISL